MGRLRKNAPPHARSFFPAPSSFLSCFSSRSPLSKSRLYFHLIDTSQDSIVRVVSKFHVNRHVILTWPYCRGQFLLVDPLGSKLSTSLVFRVLRVKTQRRCLRKHPAILRSFGSLSHDQVSQPNSNLTISRCGAR